MVTLTQLSLGFLQYNFTLNLIFTLSLPPDPTTVDPSVDPSNSPTIINFGLKVVYFGNDILSATHDYQSSFYSIVVGATLNYK